MNVVSTLRLADKKAPEINYAALKECEALRVMVFNGKDLYGTISFSTDTDFGQIGQEWNQWVTLFDDPDDDLFDGELGEDDEDVPRIHLTFKLI
jgi:hypothetical protein